MSRIGRKPIAIPQGVSVTLNDHLVTVKGPKGELSYRHPEGVGVKVEGQVVCVDEIGAGKAMHGLVRALLNNMVAGCVKEFEKKLEIQGVGYQASIKGDAVSLQVGFSKPVVLTVPKGVKVVASDPTHLTVSGCDKQAVGQFAAQIRVVRPPEPYKGKGIRYQGEFVRRKAGKAFGAK